MKRLWLIIPVTILVLSSCSSPPDTPPTLKVEPTQPPPPTNTSLPPEPTATSGPIIFIDDFDGGVDTAWSWLNEDPGRWQITPDGWLAITANHPSVLASEQNIEQVNLLTQPAPQGDLIITTRLISNPDENFQQAGIFIVQDGQNYVSIINAFCEFCLPDTGGHGVFMEGFKNGEPTAQGMVTALPLDQNDLYLRLVFSSSQNTITGYFSDDSSGWQQVGVVDEVPAFTTVALGAANTPGPEGISEDLLALFDYFEIAVEDTPIQTGSPLPEIAFTPEPSNTPEPTATLEPTPLSEGVMFRDDFEGYL